MSDTSASKSLFDIAGPDFFVHLVDPFRWRDRQLASKLERLDAVGAGMFVAEGDLVVDRAIELHYEAVALLCDEPTGIRLAESVGESVQVFIGSEQLRGDVTGLGVPLRASERGLTVGQFRQ